jgi:hypothetical protein
MKEEIVNDYVNNFLGTMEIASKYDISRTKVQRYLIKANVKLRKRTPAYKVEHYFFSEYNENSCYWAGFILADGYIRNKNRFTLEIKLQKQDVQHLEKFKNDIKYEGKIFEKKMYYSISISSSQIIQDLNDKFEIGNKKSLTCYISDRIPKKFLKDYIRGYFDGDGCITYTTINAITFLGTENTVDFIRNYFYEYVGVKLRSKDMPNITRNGNIFVIGYSGKSALNCLDHMYNDSKIYLDRKFKKYCNLILNKSIKFIP